jgi:carbamoyl-phosphate synthase large subunit
MLGQQLAAMGYELIATSGTWKVLNDAGVRVQRLPKLAEGRPNIRDLIMNEDIDLVINTPTRRGPTTDEGKIRALATMHKTPLITTITAARAAVAAIAALRAGGAEGWTVRPLQEYFPQYRRGEDQ